VSDIIQLLPEHIANQIAAGEVVQRPASVVKELLENALDAGAEHIRLVVKDAGKTLVQVIDDGIGMSETDARMSFERHATSKIRKAEDLFNLHTMGFRGEALASIAAVAQVEMRTRKREHELGLLIQNEASQIIAQEPCQTAIGTSIAVKNLFFNIPARRNFLKSNQIEMQHISQEFERIALANPSVFFSLHHNGQQVFHLPKSNLRQRIIYLMGSKLNQGLIPIGEHTDALKINGFVGKPEFAKKTRGEQFFFVNNRFIKSSYLHHAVMSAYEDLLPQNMNPLYVIFLDIDPARIDVNVHPTKQEIKFEDERLIYNYLRVTTRHALAQHSITPSLDFEDDQALHQQYSAGIIDTEIAQNSQTVGEINQNGEPNEEEEQTEKNDDDSDSDTSVRAAFFAFQQQNLPKNNQSNSNPNTYSKQQTPLQEHNLHNWQQLYQSVGNSNLGNEGNKKTDEGVKIQSLISAEDSNLSSNEQKQPYQLHQRYIVSPVRSGFMLIDQQAAHQRILYEMYLDNFHKAESSSQQKLFPSSVVLSATHAQTLLLMLPTLLKFGIELRAFNQHTFLVHGLPPLLADTNEQKLIESLIEQQLSPSQSLQIQAYEKIAYLLAQKSAVGNQRLTAIEMQQIIDQLFACQSPHQAPNGQKTFIIIDTDEINRRFA
jgi:DNA mismatch repair protein MutL